MFPMLSPGHGVDEVVQGDATAYALRQGVMRRWLTLEQVVGRAYRKPVRRLEPVMRSLLLAGAYELLFQDGTPGPAVVTAYVDVAKERVRAGAGGLVNAVLRKIAGWREEAEVVEGCEADAKVFPLDGGRGLRLGVDVLPAPVEDRVGYASSGFSLSRELVKRWLDRFGEDAWGVMRQTLERAPVVVWVGDSGLGVGDEWARHEANGFAVWLGGMDRLAEVMGKCEGVRVQDPTAALAVSMTSGLEVKRVLDLCAGRGTKTVQARAMHPEAEVWAYEPHDGRRATLEASVAGDERVRVVGDEDLGREVFDLVLADVPCTNSGVLARRLEARYRFKSQTLDDVRGVQKQILGRAVELAASGGRVVYSTCSLESEENEMQVQRLMRKRVGMHLESQELDLPGGSGVTYHDGGFRAMMLVD